MRDEKVRTTTNNSGGVQGGISNGEDIFFRVAFKPTSTIARDQKTVTTSGEETTLAARGRHDPCVLPRAVPIVEAMAALVLCDHALRQNAISEIGNRRPDRYKASEFVLVPTCRFFFPQSEIRHPKSPALRFGRRFSSPSRSFCILFEMIRGWRLGILRQLMRVAAVVAAYAAACFGGDLLVPLLRPFLQMPDFVISALAGAILAMIVYGIIASLGSILFKRTAQQSSGAVRLVYGLSGAAVGLCFGAFFIWLMLVGIRIGWFHRRRAGAGAGRRVESCRANLVRRTM